MSHFTTIKTEILDLNILKQTICDLGFTIQEGNNLTIRNGHILSVDFFVRIDSKSSIGFKEQSSGKGYSIIVTAETYHRKNNGRIIQMIQQEYAYRKVLHETRKRGFSLVEEQRVKAGVIKLILKKVA